MYSSPRMNRLLTKANLLMLESRQSLNQNNVQKLSIEVTLPSGTIFSVPAASVISELPDDVDTQEFIKVKANSGDRREYFIAQSTLFFRLDDPDYLKRIQNRLPLPALPTNVTKKDKEIAALKREKEIGKEDLKRDRERISFLEGENKKLQKGLNDWRNLYQSMRSIKDENEQEAFYQYEERTRIEREKDGIIEQLSRQVFRLRSDIEEVKITEDKILAEWNDLVSGIENCTRMIGYRLSLSESWSKTDKMLKSFLNLNHPVFEKLTIDEFYLPAELLRLVLSAAEKHLYSTLTQWSDSEYDEPGVLGSGLSKFELELNKLLESSITKGRNLPIATLGLNEVDPVLLEKAFYRWRSDTIRLLSYIEKRTPCGNKNQMVAQTAQEICVQLLASLPISNLSQANWGTPRGSVGAANSESEYYEAGHQSNQQTSSRAQHNGSIGRDVVGLQSDAQKTASKLENHAEPYMAQLADMMESLGMNKEDLELAMDILVKQVGSCVNQAIVLYRQMRCCRPNYVFQWMDEGKNFHSKKMTSVRDPNSETAFQRGPNLKVIFCKYPGIFKYGDDEGNSYANLRVVAPSVVISDGQIARNMQHQNLSNQPDGVPQDLTSQARLRKLQPDLGRYGPSMQQQQQQQQHPPQSGTSYLMSLMRSRGRPSEN